MRNIPGRKSLQLLFPLATMSSTGLHQKPKIFITRPDIPNSAINLLKDYDLDIWDKEMTVPRDVFLKKIVGMDALFISANDILDVNALNTAGNNLKVVGTLSSGLDHVDVEEVKKRGIKLGSVANVLNDAVAELAIGLLLSCTRRLFESNSQVKNGEWTPWRRWDSMNGSGLKGSVVGIVGLGRIGLEIAKRIVPFKPSKILYVSRSVKKEAEEIKATKVTLEELLTDSDMVIISLSLNKDTKGFISEEKLNLMKSTAYLVNVSRGSTIDQDALLRMLKKKRIGGAALDVMTPEPLPKDHELLKLDNCCITSHIGSAETSTRIRMAETVSENIIAGLTGNPLPNEV